MPKPKNNIRVIMYVSYPLKMKIGLFMRKNNVKSYSEFLRMATFFLMNNQISTETHDIWQIRKKQTKNSILHDPKHDDKLAVMNELKELFKTGVKLLKKIE